MKTGDFYIIWISTPAFIYKFSVAQRKLQVFFRTSQTDPYYQEAKGPK